MCNYSYDGDLNFRQGVFDKFNLTIRQSMAESPINFKQACIKRASEIGREHDLAFALSGGIWSHVTYMSFVEAGYKLPVKILNLPDSMNKHDVENAKNLANYVGADIEMVNVNLKDEVISYYVEAGTKYQTYGFADALMAKVAEIKKTNLFIADSIVFKRNVEPGWRLILDEGSNFYYNRFNHFNKHKIFNNFFTGSPELLQSFTNNSVVQDIFNDRIKNKLSTNTSIKRILASESFELPDRMFHRFTFGDFLPEFSKKLNMQITRKQGYKRRIITIPQEQLNASLMKGGLSCSFI